ncbi:hypothetical protein [Deminuibacter soli]|uniref:DUF928 domain-containing protein n=1 Tax=Deminuibacter soli TaxID=2291815 RepID=A0A3E1NG55_9BACT|nr:hypothetical protein [Deminuibacter soli]RFM26956.1 hypothetical protein DXN05_18400 [Deminuibacter soli]
MLKKYAVIATCLLLLLQANAQQVSMTTQVPPAGVMLKSQLWNMVLVNPGNSPVTVYIGLSLLSTADNRPVLTATTKRITLMKGARQLTNTDLGPVSYTYLSPALSNDMDPNGMLPAGNYMACFTVYAQVYETVQTLAEECVPVEVQPLNPPQLNTPADESVLDMAYPQFTWLPPVPLQLFSNLQYDFLLVAAMPGQSPYQAIQQNIPVYNTHTGNVPYINYPSSNITLDTGVNYAWCVVARNNNEFIAQSEVWTFKIQHQVAVKKTVTGAGYIRLKNYADAAIAACSGKLSVLYENENKDSLVQYSIRLIDAGFNGDVINGSAAVAMGENYLDIDLGGRTLEDKRVYLFEIHNSRKETWSTRFIYTRPKE